MDILTGKKVCAVRLENTITEGADLPYSLGTVRAGAREKLEAIRKEGYHVVIVSGLTNTQNGTRLTYKFIADQAIPYDDLFCGFGLPAADRWIDDRAEKLNG